jgi:hypothetical protein
MVRYFLVAAAVMASLAGADSAMAWGRRGCSSCNAGGCPGGVCAVPVAPSKMAATDAPPAAVVEQSAPAPAVVPTASVPAARSYANYNVRRGLFGWRR